MLEDRGRFSRVANVRYTRSTNVRGVQGVRRRREAGTASFGPCQNNLLSFVRRRNVLVTQRTIL